MGPKSVKILRQIQGNSIHKYKFLSCNFLSRATIIIVRQGRQKTQRRHCLHRIVYETATSRNPHNPSN